MKYAYTALLLLLATSPTAGLAEPLIDEGLQIGTIAVFPDHATAGKCHYVPAPRLASRQDGTPHVTFLEYIKTGGAESIMGGTLQFAMELGLAADQLAKLRAESAKSTLRCASLSPITFTGGKFYVVSADFGEGGAFTRTIVGQGNAPLLTGSKAAVSISIKPEGATLIKRALEQTGYGLDVAFDMHYQGLTAHYDVQGFLDWGRSREFFEREAKQAQFEKREIRIGSTVLYRWYVKVGDQEWSELQDVLKAEGSIIIERIGGEDAALDSVLETLVERIMQTLTETSLDLSKFTSEGGENPESAGTLPYGVRTKTQNISQTGKFKIELHGRQRVERETGPMTADIGGTLRRLQTDPRVHRLIDLDDPDFQTRDIFVSLDGETLQNFGEYINYATVMLRKSYRDPTRAVKTAELVINRKTLEDSSNALKWTYPLLGEDAAHGGLNYDYRFVWSFLGGVKIDTNWQSSDQPTPTIAAPLVARKITLMGDASNLQERGVMLITVAVRSDVAGRTRLKEIKINPAESTLAEYAYYHQPGDLNYAYQITWFMRDGQRQATGWKNTADAFINLRSDPTAPAP